MAERLYRTKPLYAVEICGADEADGIAQWEQRITDKLEAGWLLVGSPCCTAAGALFQALRRPDAEIDERRKAHAGDPSNWHEPDWKKNRGRRS